jgi:hypothetical protein
MTNPEPTARRTFTDEVLDDQMAAILRTKTPAERLAMAFEMWSFARQLMRRTTAHLHPDWTDEEIDRHVARRMSHGEVDEAT